jgi:hypothetical protein
MRDMFRWEDNIKIDVTKMGIGFILLGQGKLEPPEYNTGVLTDLQGCSM